MIPQFPEFKKLELEDREEVERFIKLHPPYSDFNFVSLWSYNTQEKVELSFLNKNLVMKFSDYITDEVFFTLLGTTKIEQTIHALMSEARRLSIVSELRMVPHIVVEDTKLHEKFLITEDRDNFDYILDVQELSELKGSKYRAKRNFVNRFKRLYPHCEVKEIDLNNPRVRECIIELFLLWEKQMNKTRKDTETELKATNRLLDISSHLDLLNIGIYDSDKLIAFSLNEVVHNNYGVIEFEKADTAYIGIYAYLKYMTAVHLAKHGVKYINYEQDLGLEPLRKAKESWNPVNYLKKYKISAK